MKTVNPLLCVIAIALCLTANAATKTSTASGGLWSAGGSWVGGVAPGNGDSIVIVNASTITMDAAGLLLTYQAIHIVGTGTLNTISGTLNLSGGLSSSTATSKLLSTDTTHIINVGGNWGYLGTTNVLATSGPKVVLNGTADQNIPGRFSSGTTAPTTGGVLIINKASGIAKFTAISRVRYFTLTAGTLDGGTTLTTTIGPNRVSAGRLRVGTTNWTGSFATTVTQATGSIIEYYFVGAVTVMAGRHGGNVELTGITGAKNFAVADSVIGTLSLTATTGTIVYAGTIVGPVSISTTGVSASTFSALVTAKSAITLSGTASATFTVIRTLSGNVTLSGTAVMNAGAAIAGAPILTLSGALSIGQGTSFVVGRGIRLIAPSNTTVSGTLQIGCNTTALSHSLSGIIIASTGTLSVLAFSQIQTITGVVTINGKLTITEFDTKTLGANVFADSLIINGTATISSKTTYSKPVMIGNGAKLDNTLGYVQTFSDNVFNDGTIKKGSTTAMTFAKALTINDVNDTFINTATGPVTVTGVLTINGKFLNTSTGALTVVGATTVGVGATLSSTGNAILIYGAITVNGSVVNGGTTALKTYNGNVTVNSGGSFVFPTGVTGIPTFNADIIINTGGTYTETGTMAPSFRGNFTNNGTYTANASVHTFAVTNKSINGTSAITIANVTIPAAVTITNNATNFRVSTAFAGGNATTSVLYQGSGSGLTIGGTVTVFVSAFSNINTLTYNGTAVQTVLKGTYYNLVVNNSNAAGVTLGGNVNLVNNLTLTDGMVTLSTFNLDVNGAISGTDSTATTGKYIVTNSTGRLVLTVDASPLLFPVGTSITSYNPIIITNNGTSDDYGVRVLSVITAPASNSTTRMVTRYWNISETVAGGSDLEITTQWSNRTGEVGATFSTGSVLKFGYHNGASWITQLPSSSVLTNPSKATASLNLTNKSIRGGITIGIGKDLGITLGTATIILDTTITQAFGLQCITIPSNERIYTVSGYNLSANITVTPPVGFEVSFTSGSGFVTSPSTLTITQTGGYETLVKVYLRFLPDTALAFTGINVSHTSSGATAKTIALTGTGRAAKPTLTTPSVYLRNSTILLFDGIMTDGGCTDVTERGFYWSYTSGFVNGAGTKLSITGSAIGAGQYLDSLSVASFTGGNTVYIKSFATNSYGTTYSAQSATGVFIPSGANTRYAVADGDWASTTVWSATANGLAGASVPIDGSYAYIQNNRIVTVSTASVQVDGVVIEEGGKLICTGTFNATAGLKPVIQLWGTLERVNATFNYTSLAVRKTGRYVHKANGGAIPVAIWDSATTCEITGVAGTLLTALNQTFGNFIWNCPAQTLVNLNFPDAGTMAIKGNLTIASTGATTGFIELNQAALTVNNYIQTGGIFDFGIIGAITVLGNATISGGSLKLGNSTFAGTFNVAGDFSYTAGSTVTEGTSSNLPAIVFNGTTLQTVTNGGTLSGEVDFTVDTSAIVDFGTNTITGSTGSFTVYDSATVYTKHAGGFSTTASTGAIQHTGTKTYASQATYIYNGSSAQLTGNGFTTATVSKIITENAAGVTASVALIITDSLIIGESTPNSIFSDGGHQISTVGVLDLHSGTFKMGGAAATTVPDFSSILLGSGTTVEYGAAVAQNVGALNGLDYQNLTFSGAGQKNTTSNLVVWGNWSTSGGVASMGGFTVDLAGSVTGTGNITFGAGILTIGNNWTNNGTFTAGTGTVIYADTNGAKTIASVTYHNLEMHNVSVANSLAGNTQVLGDFSFTSTGTGKLVAGSNTLTFGGDIINMDASRCLILNGSSNLSITGSIEPGSSLFFDQTTPGTTNRVNNFTLNRTGQTVTLGNMLEVRGTYTPTDGVLATGDELKLVSNASGTARVATGSGNGYITGNVIVERYVPALERRWRFFSPPVSGATLLDLQNEIYVTGLDGSANGFDQTVSNQTSIYTYNEAVTTGNLNSGWVAPANINDDLTVGKGVRLFIRGDRSDPGRLEGTKTDQNAVVVNVNGPLNMGDITMPVTYNSSGNVANDGWNFVGNPYASSYDWDAFFDANSGTANCFNIASTVYIFNPNSDGYVSFNAFGGEPGTGNLVDGIIPSAAGFWVKATGPNPTLVLTEQYKIATIPTPVFKTDQNEAFTIRLEKDSISYDNVIIKYTEGSTVNKDPYDIVKLSATWTNISAYGGDSVQLTASVRPLVSVNDTIKLSIDANASGTYKMKFYNSASIGENVYLIDSYLNTVTDIKTTREYAVTVDYTTTGVGSYGLNRFYIVVGELIHSSLQEVKMENHSPATIEMYPVPAKDELTITTNIQTIKEVKVYNSMGKLEFRQAASSGKVSVDVQRLKTGIYMLEVLNENGDVIQKKFLKE
jgi:fibronectin-binding autotransporter adhesin